MRRYVKAKRVAVAGECYATASCSLSMAKPLALTELQTHAIGKR